MSRIKDVWVFANNIIRTARQLVNEELKPLGLTSAEGNILLHLLTQSQILRQEDIVEQLDISKPAVSKALESLEVKGFVVRDKDPADKRVSLVQLTNQAREIGPEVERIYNQVFTTAAQGLTDHEIEGAVNFFGLVSDNFTSARKLKKGGNLDVAE